MIDSDLIDIYIFKHPFTCMIAGPTMSGKTTILSKILKNQITTIDTKIDRIIYCYARYQDSYDKMKITNPNIEF